MATTPEWRVARSQLAGLSKAPKKNADLIREARQRVEQEQIVAHAVELEAMLPRMSNETVERVAAVLRPYINPDK